MNFDIRNLKCAFVPFEKTCMESYTASADNNEIFFSPAIKSDRFDPKNS